MTLAHLILAHDAPLQLQRLVERLRHPGVHIYIHLDAKSDVRCFKHLEDNRQVFFIRNRTAVEWGSWSLTQATLDACNEIIATGRSYNLINLLSGRDYPLCSAAELHDFFSERPDKLFMHCLSVEDEWSEAKIRLSRYDFGSFRFRGRYRLQAIWNLLAPVRKMPEGLKAYGRSQWFTLPPVAIQYVIDYLRNHPRVERYFRFTWGADELLFQTLLCNSHHSKNIINNNYRYVDWSEGNSSPRLLCMKDIPKMLCSGALFARKFSLADEAVLDFLDRLAMPGACQPKSAVQL